MGLQDNMAPFTAGMVRNLRQVDEYLRRSA
jgi:hypothetical protein